MAQEVQEVLPVVAPRERRAPVLLASEQEKTRDAEDAHNLRKHHNQYERAALVDKAVDQALDDAVNTISPRTRFNVYVGCDPLLPSRKIFKKSRHPQRYFSFNVSFQNSKAVILRLISVSTANYTPRGVGAQYSDVHAASTVLQTEPVAQSPSPEKGKDIPESQSRK